MGLHNFLFRLKSCYKNMLLTTVWALAETDDDILKTLLIWYSYENFYNIKALEIETARPSLLPTYLGTVCELVEESVDSVQKEVLQEDAYPLADGGHGPNALTDRYNWWPPSRLWWLFAQDEDPRFACVALYTYFFNGKNISVFFIVISGGLLRNGLLLLNGDNNKR